MSRGIWLRDKKAGFVNRRIARLNRAYGDETPDWQMWQMYEDNEMLLQQSVSGVNQRIGEVADKDQGIGKWHTKEGVIKWLQELAEHGVDWRDIDVGPLSYCDYFMDTFIGLPWDVQSQDEHPKNVLSAWVGL
jgi:hypothetical protein